MINELIEFAALVKHANRQVASSVYTPNKKYKQVFIVNTLNSETRLEFSGYELLKTDIELDAFIKTVPELELLDANNFITWIVTQNRIRSSGNKRLGSVSGLMNSVPYVCILTSKNFANFENKAKEMRPPTSGWKTYQEVQNNITESLSQIYITFWKSANLKDSDINSLVFVLFPKIVAGIPREELYKAFERDRKYEWENDEYCSTKKLSCPVCQKEDVLGTHEYDTYQLKKPFLMHLGRPERFSFRLCMDCSVKYSDAMASLRKAGFKIFPLFAKNSIPSGMTFTNDNGSALSFSAIFSEIEKHAKKERYDFQLMAISGSEVWLCDYVSGYSPYFKGKGVDGYTRFIVEDDIWEILGIKRESGKYPYFTDEPESPKYRNTPRWIKSYIYTFRESIFNFVYRGQDTITKEMLTELVDAAIRHKITEQSNAYKSCTRICELTLSLFRIVRWRTMEEIQKEDQENAKKLGEAFRIVVSLSEAENTHNLISPVLDKPCMEDVKRGLSKLLDKFHYKFGDLSSEQQELISTCLEAQYKVDRFELLKMYFYAGYFKVKK